MEKYFVDGSKVAQILVYSVSHNLNLSGGRRIEFLNENGTGSMNIPNRHFYEQNDSYFSAVSAGGTKAKKSKMPVDSLTLRSPLSDDIMQWNPTMTLSNHTLRTLALKASARVCVGTAKKSKKQPLI